MKLEDYLLIIEKFIQNYLVDNHQDCYVLGLSGGVDSSLAAAITKKAVGKNKLFCVMIPIDSNPDDLDDALFLANTLDINYVIFDGSDLYHAYINEYTRLGFKLDRSTIGNLKARIRMSILYGIAQNKRGLVMGTDNADETYVGYFTKYGDGGVDLLPLKHLTKHEVVEASKILGIPSKLAERIPTAGLFEGQTDEGEMGVKYKDLDNYLLGKEIDVISRERIEHLHKISEHKRKPIPSPIPFKR